jgi:hypothetical protein
VPTSGPSARIGLTASELIGLPRPSGISTYTPTDAAAAGEKVGGLKVDKVEGERKWNLKEVEEGTEESVREAIAFFDEMDDLVGLVRRSRSFLLFGFASFDPARSSTCFFIRLASSFVCAGLRESRRRRSTGSPTKSTCVSCSLKKMPVSCPRFLYLGPHNWLAGC